MIRQTHALSANQIMPDNINAMQRVVPAPNRSMRVL